MNRLTKVFLFLILVVASGGWYLLKVFQFQINQENYGDGLVVLQLSRGWLEGRPLLFDTIYGNHTLEHNYYFILLVGIFTKPLGIYGLFVAYLCLLGLFFGKLYQAFASFAAMERTAVWLTAFLFAFGPMAYFIYLDYFGWHVEQYFIPLLALLSLSLAKRQFRIATLWLFLLFLVKESSAVLICCLVLFCSIVDMILVNPVRHWSRYLLEKRNLIIIGISLALFALCLLWLSHLNGARSTRLSKALLHIEPSKTLLLYIVFSCLVGLLTFGIALLPFIPWLQVSPRKNLVIWLLAGCYAILFVMFSIEALFYYPTIYPGISYPARIGGLWGFMLSAFIFFSYRLTKFGVVPYHMAVNWILTGCLLQFLFSSFLVAHQFTIESRPSILTASMSNLVKTRLGLNPYSEGVPKQLYELAKRLPVGADVIVPYNYMSYFENVYPGLVNYNKPPLHVVRKPLIYVLQKELMGSGIYSKLPKAGYKIIRDDHLMILADSNWYNSNVK